MTDLVTRYGSLRVPDIESDPIGRSLAQYGEWAQYEISFVAGNLSDGARVADIGAFVGTFGLGLAQRVKLAGVCFVEANPLVAPLLRDNITRNPLPAVTVVEAAIMPDSGHQEASVAPGDTGSWSLAPRHLRDTRRVKASSPARSLSLPDLRRECGPFALIKLDVGGTEQDILRGDGALLESGEAVLWLACDEAVESLDLGEMLINRGLKVFYAAFPAFSADNFLASPDRIFPFAHRSWLWATRGDRPHLDSSLAEASCVLLPISNREDLRSALWNTPRWAPPHWLRATPQATVAAAAHDLLGHEFETFLMQPPNHRRQSSMPNFDVLGEELARARESIRLLEQLLHHDRSRMADIEEQIVGMKMANASMAARLQAESEANRARSNELISVLARLEAAEAEAAQLRGVVESIHRSTSWRIMTRVTARLAGHPTARRLLRGGLRAVNRFLRAIRPNAPL